ncbi:MAG: HAD-IA family hydrolase [Planctomycetota bacterium]
MTPTIVCFDWGGVLLRICRDFDEGVHAAGLDLRPGAITPAFYDIGATVSRAYQVGELDSGAFFEQTSAAMNGAYTPAEIERIHDAWLLGEYDGAEDLMNELNTLTGVETAMLSNTNASHWARRLTEFPACGHAKHQHASHVMGLLKPDPAIYTRFASEVGCSPDAIIYFDDLAENIDAAQSAGWRAIHVDHTGDTASAIRTELLDQGLPLKNLGTPDA